MSERETVSRAGQYSIRRESSTWLPGRLRQAVAILRAGISDRADLHGRLAAAFPTRGLRALAAITLSSLAVVIVSGTYLALLFDPATTEVTYAGPVDNLRGLTMPGSFASAMKISFEVRGGLFIRQLHNWSSSLFLVSLLLTLAVTFFTGALRRTRRAVWLVDVVTLILGVFAAFTGVLLLGDLASGTSLRMISGYLLSIPVIGTWLHWTAFGGEFPGTDIGPRLYLLHLVLPALVVGLLALRARLLGPNPVRQRRPATALFVATVGGLAVLAGLFQVNPLWNYGPANAAHVSAGAAPPWYFGWVDGAVRLWPALPINLGDYEIPPWFWPSMVFLPLSFLALASYPWLDRLAARGNRNRRISLGVAVLTLYGLLQLTAAIDVIAVHFHLSADALLWTGRIAVLTLPPLAYAVTYRLCLGRRLAARTGHAQGVQTGRLNRLPNGGYTEHHLTAAGKQLPS
jgi:ubiquinol-cytochrome c reductase cytochrome b subunit